MPTYNPATPLPSDIPADSQDDFVTNFQLINQFFGQDHIPFGNTVQFATNANPCVCKSALHGLTTGNTITISHFGSLVGDVIVRWNINGGPYTVTVIDEDTFSINADASANPEYLPDTGAFTCAQFNYGFHKKNFLPNVLIRGPNTIPPRGSPYSAYYSKAQVNPATDDQTKLAELFFQNGVGEGFERQLTNLNFVEVSTKTGKGVKTPWGLIINFGQIDVPLVTTNFQLPIPFTTAFWSITGTLQLAKNKNLRPFYVLNALGLTQFTALQRTAQEPGPSFVPGFYLAIGF
jgi:hypothetical protein